MKSVHCFDVYTEAAEMKRNANGVFQGVGSPFPESAAPSQHPMPQILNLNTKIQRKIDLSKYL